MVRRYSCNKYNKCLLFIHFHKQLLINPTIADPSYSPLLLQIAKYSCINIYGPYVFLMLLIFSKVTCRCWYMNRGGRLIINAQPGECDRSQALDTRADARKAEAAGLWWMKEPLCPLEEVTRWKGRGGEKQTTTLNSLYGLNHTGCLSLLWERCPMSMFSPLGNLPKYLYSPTD